MPVGLLFLGKSAAVWILVPLAGLAITLDIARQRIPAAKRLIEGCFAFMMRPEELPAKRKRLVLNGATWMCVAAALVAILFDEPIAAAGLVMLMVGDGVAAVVGRKYGTLRYPNSPKSLQGSLAFFVVACVGCLPLLGSLWGHPPVSMLQIGAGALAATIVEALPIPINDNLRVPLVASLVISAL